MNNACATRIYRKIFGITGYGFQQVQFVRDLEATLEYLREFSFKNTSENIRGFIKKNIIPLYCSHKDISVSAVIFLLPLMYCKSNLKIGKLDVDDLKEKLDNVIKEVSDNVGCKSEYKDAYNTAISIYEIMIMEIKFKEISLMQLL